LLHKGERRIMMKNFIFLIVLFSMLFVVGSRTANAQKVQFGSAPKSFRVFFAKFRSAVERSDKKAVAAMTVFPFEYAIDTGGEGTMTKAQFIKDFKKIFGQSPKLFMEAEKKPRFSRGDEGSYNISTEYAEHFIFIKKGNTYKFTGYFAEP